MVERTIELDWNSVVLLAMLLFSMIGLRHGWQRGLVTLVSFFFAWGVALKTVDFLIAAIGFVLGIELSDDLRGLFQIGLYVASVIMVVVTFNSKIIPTRVVDRRDRLSGITTGLLNGYFFVVLLLDLGRDWIATHFEGFTLVFNGNLSLDGSFGRALVTLAFVNNPFAAYEDLIKAQNLILLVLLLVFWHGLLFALLGRVDKTLRAT